MAYYTPYNTSALGAYSGNHNSIFYIEDYREYDVEYAYMEEESNKASVSFTSSFISLSTNDAQRDISRTALRSPPTFASSSVSAEKTKWNSLKRIVRKIKNIF